VAPVELVTFAVRLDGSSLSQQGRQRHPILIIQIVDVIAVRRGGGAGLAFSVHLIAEAEVRVADAGR